MATSSVMQSTLVSPVKGATKGLGFSRMSSCVYMPCQLRSSSVVVRCMTGDSQKGNAEPVTSPKPKVSTNFFDVLAFSGPAPERINGRLAMIGFVAAIAVELFKGQDVFAQIADGGVSWFLLTTVVLSVASLIPLSSGVTVEEKSQEIMSSDAEMWNGRFAMLGLVALAFTEFVKGGALIA